MKPTVSIVEIDSDAPKKKTNPTTNVQPSFNDVLDQFRVLSGKAHIHICTPCYGCKMRKEFLLSLMQLQGLAGRIGVGVSIDFIGNESLITRGRNILAAKFLKGAGTHLLFIDADIAFDPLTVFRLAAFDKDIVTAVYPKKFIEWELVKAKVRANDSEPVQAMGLDYNINIAGSTAQVTNNFIKVLDSATGFMMITKDALQKVVDHNKDTLSCINDVTSSRDFVPGYVAVFDTMICPETKRYLSEDYAFCRRAQMVGLEIWADIASPLAHIGAQQLHGDVMQRYELAYKG